MRLLSAFSILTIMACAPSLHAEQRGPYPEKFYRYTSVRGPLEYINITIDPNLKRVVYVDVEVGQEIIDDPSGTSPTILSFNQPYNVVFYLPENFDSEMKGWTYKTCKYQVVGFGYGFRPRANRQVYEYLIEQRCDGDAKIVRYEYADYYGLQSFGIGQYKGATSDGEPIFELQDAYALYGAEIGFGARGNN